MPKPLSIEIQTRLVFYERVLDVVDDATAIRTGKEVGPAESRAGTAAKGGAARDPGGRGDQR